MRDGPGPGARRRRDAARVPLPGVAIHPPGAGVGAPSGGRPARPPRRTLERVLRRGHREGAAASGLRRLHERNGGGRAPSGGGRGVSIAHAARRAHRRPAAQAAGHRREPDDRPGRAVREPRPRVPRATGAGRSRRRGGVARGRRSSGRGIRRSPARSRARELSVRGATRPDLGGIARHAGLVRSPARSRGWSG